MIHSEAHHDCIAWGSLTPSRPCPMNASESGLIVVNAISTTLSTRFLRSGLSLSTF